MKKPPGLREARPGRASVIDAFTRMRFQAAVGAAGLGGAQAGCRDGGNTSAKAHVASSPLPPPQSRRPASEPGALFPFYLCAK